MHKFSKTIVFITGQLGLGGAEKQLFLLASQLRDQNWDVSIITLSPETNNYYQFPLLQKGIEIFGIPLNSSRIVRLVKIIGYLKRKKPSIVHSWCMFTNLYAVIGGRLGNISKIMGSERANENLTISEMGKFKYNLNLIGLSCLVTNNHKAADMLLLSHPNVKTFVVPNGITIPVMPKSRAECRQKLGIPLDAIVIGGVGRLEARKNFTLFIEIASKLAQQQPNIFFAIFGDGPERQQLEKLAGTLLPPNSWKFFGHLPNVDTFFSVFDVFCYTSLPFEGMPNVIMEAAAAGVPVVASAVDEVPVLVEDEKTGYLVKNSDPDAFVERILSLIEDKKRCKLLGEAGRYRMQALFSVSSMATQMTNIYTNDLP